MSTPHALGLGPRPHQRGSGVVGKTGTVTSRGFRRSRVPSSGGGGAQRGSSEVAFGQRPTGRGAAGWRLWRGPRLWSWRARSGEVTHGVGPRQGRCVLAPGRRERPLGDAVGVRKLWGKQDWRVPVRCSWGGREGRRERQVPGLQPCGPAAEDRGQGGQTWLKVVRGLFRGVAKYLHSHAHTQGRGKQLED